MKQKMTFLDRINSIKSAFTGSPNQSLLSMAARFTPVLGEPPKRNTEDWFDLYNKSPRMNPVHQIASDIATSMYGIYNKNDTKKIKLKDNSIESLLKKPCDNQTITEYVLFYITQVYLLLPSGEAFWLLERNGTGKVTELWPLPPHWVSEIPSKTKPFYTVQPLGNMQAQPIYVLPEDMIFFKKPNIINPYLRGIGHSTGISDEIEVDEYMSKYQKRFFFNDAIPSMVIQMPGADEATVNRAEEGWNSKFGGYNNKHKTAFVNWELKAQILKETNKDMDFIASRKYLRDEANQHFSIPPELFGILENSNRSTIDAAYYLYTKNVLRKELKFIGDTINVQLIPNFSKNIYFEFDNVVPEDEEFELKKASEGLKNGGLTVDEWRIANGWEELPNNKGQIIYTPLNMIPTTLNGNALETNLEPQQRGLPNEEIKKKINIEQKERLWYIFDKAAVKNERSFINILKKYFQQQQDKINDKLTKSIKQVTDNPDELLDWDEEDALLLIALTPLWLNSLKEGYEIANSTYGLGISFDLLNPKFLNWIDEFGAGQVTKINNTTKEKLRKTLSEGIIEGESIPKLRDRVSSIMTEAKTTRATLIARTETHNTVGYGTFETYKTTDIQQKGWLTTLDGRERSSHNAINGEVVGMDQSFSNGLMYPGDASGPASEIIACRCVLLPIIPD